MKIMSGEEVIAHLREKPDQVMFWCRSGPGEKWVLLPRVAERGMEYGMRHWEFFGPVLNPDQLAAREPLAYLTSDKKMLVFADMVKRPTDMLPLYP